MSLLENILEKVESKNPRHGKKLRNSLSGLDDDYYQNAESFFKRYQSFAENNGKTLDYGVNSYLKVVSDTLYEQIRFHQTGEYSCKSFQDAYDRVYNNPDVMEYYMHGLLMTQFLWKHHYSILNFFRDTLPGLKQNISNYLEIGGGHGLYLSEAMRLLKDDTEFHMVDISTSSLDMAKQFVGTGKVKYMLQDIYKYEKDSSYEFITMGEVLEHVEDPLGLMQQIHRLLKDDGYAFITAPANAPAIDHISLFESADDIREIFKNAGFKVVKDLALYTEKAKKGTENVKIPLMYGALIKK